MNSGTLSEARGAWTPMPTSRLSPSAVNEQTELLQKVAVTNPRRQHRRPPPQSSGDTTLWHRLAGDPPTKVSRNSRGGLRPEKMAAEE